MRMIIIIIFIEGLKKLQTDQEEKIEVQKEGIIDLEKEEPMVSDNFSDNDSFY